jgi:hypothetical protein
MTVPPSQTDDAPVRRGKARADTGCPACRVPRETPPDQIRDRRRIGDGWNPVPCRLNIGCGYRLNSDVLLKIADRDVERASGEQIRRGIVVARLGKLPVRGSAGEMHNGQGSNKHNKGKNYDERSAFGGAVTRMEESFHEVKSFMGLEGLQGEIK